MTFIARRLDRSGLLHGGPSESAEQLADLLPRSGRQHVIIRLDHVGEVVAAVRRRDTAPLRALHEPVHGALAEQPDRRVADGGVWQVAELEVEDRPRLSAPA